MTTEKEKSKISVWLERIPDNAATFKITISSLGHVQTIAEWDKAEINRDTPERIIKSCDSWVTDRTKQFVGQWISNSGRVIDTIQFRIHPEDGPVNGAPSWDGSIEQLIGALHAQLAAKDKMFLELLRTAFEANQQQLNSIMERNLYLEKQRVDTEKLKEEMVRMEAEMLSDGDDGQKFNRLASLAEKVLLARNNIESF